MPNRLLSKRATKNDLFLCLGIFAVTFLSSGILLPKVLYQISQGCNAILKISGGFGIFLPILPAIASVVISRIIFRTETTNLPFFVRFMKFGLFWFVLLLFGLVYVLYIAFNSHELPTQVVYYTLSGDFILILAGMLYSGIDTSSKRHKNYKLFFWLGMVGSTLFFLGMYFKLEILIAIGVSVIIATLVTLATTIQAFESSEEEC